MLISAFACNLLVAELRRWLSRDPIAEIGGLNLYEYVGNDPLNRFDSLGLEAEIIVQRPLGNSAGPSTVTITENGRLVGFTGNQNGYIPNGRGGPLPNGEYMLLPKPESQMYPLGDERRDTEYPVNTPSITRWGNADPSRPNYQPGRVTDTWSNVRVHGEGPQSRPDSNGCLTAPSNWPSTIKDIMMRNLTDGGTRIIYR